VTNRLCSRCHTVLHREDEGTLVFCWNCGAPQVQLSEELRDQIDRQIAGQSADTATLEPIPTPVSPTAVVWHGAIQCAGLAGAVAAAFGLLSLVVPPAGLLSIFWVVGAPAFVLIIYSGRFRQTHITAGFGARLGVLSGLAIMLASITLDIVDLLLRRFVFHAAGPVDTWLADFFTQMKASFAAQASPASRHAISLLNIPEFRAGFVLLLAAIGFVAYLIFAAAAGAVSGYIRSRAPQAVR
jgi:hypothetical protein